MFKGIKHISYSDINGVLEAIQPLEKTSIKTSVGNLIPVYKVEDHGRMKLTPVKFDKYGNIKSLQLQDPVNIKTSIGSIKTEFLTFYPDGKIRRVFPLNGKLSGYWSQENEYQLAPEMEIKTGLGVINVKPIYLHFYESGKLKSITFWPKERVSLNYMDSIINIKTGISFYESGALKSYEPAEELSVNTQIGSIRALDPDPLGINGEKNSLSYSEKGEVLTLSTIANAITVTESSGKMIQFTPKLIRSRCNDNIFVINPLLIEFKDDYVIFRNGFIVLGKVLINSKFSIQPFETSKPLTRDSNESSCA